MRVILIDPSRTAAKIISRMLEARHHDVRTFADGLEALAHIKSDPEVGVVITSAEPLSISGLELCWETRLIAGSRRSIYVIMLSSSKDHDHVALALDHGADDFLSKPPVPEELYARLRAADCMGSMQRELLRLATTDSLTGMFNRRAFFERARDLCVRAEAGEPLSAIMADIDHFKRINDIHGHDVGDEAICAVSRELMGEGILLGRLGGEEFALLLGGRALGDAVPLADMLRRKLEALDIRCGHASVKLTCSFGVSEWLAGNTIDHLLKRADMALYEAKMAGRNRVGVADHSLLSPTHSASVRAQYLRAHA